MPAAPGGAAPAATDAAVDHIVREAQRLEAERPEQAMSSRVVSRLGPQQLRLATQAAVQPTPTAASVPTIRQSPAIVGGSFSC